MESTISIFKSTGGGASTMMVEIRVNDRRVFRGEMSMENFAEAITGRGEVAFYTATTDFQDDL